MYSTASVMCFLQSKPFWPPPGTIDVQLAVPGLDAVQPRTRQGEHFFKVVHLDQIYDFEQSADEGELNSSKNRRVHLVPA